MSGDPITASVHVQAPPERVFVYFTDPDRLAEWMGQGARLDPTEGGVFAVDIAGVPVRGRYLQIEAPHRLVISWGHAGSRRLPPGSSIVEVRLTPERGGTRVDIEHRGLPEPERTGYPRGWRAFLDALAHATAVAPPPAAAP